MVTLCQDPGMTWIDLNSAFVTFFAVVGPPKVLLAYAALVPERTAAEARRVALYTSLTAAVVGLVAAFTARPVMTFFHIGHEALQLAGGIIFFIYAVGLVLGVHLGSDPRRDDPDSPVASGFRDLLLPYEVSPLAVTAVLVESYSEPGFAWKGAVALAYLVVVLVDLLCMVVLTRPLRRLHDTTLEVLNRLLGLLLAAVGVELFLKGLGDLGLLPASAINHG
jgi:multiple antibiotic resistance protein